MSKFHSPSAMCTLSNIDSYVRYRLPDDDVVHLIEGSCLAWDGSWPQESVFVMAPFVATGQCPAVMISPSVQQVAPLMCPEEVSSESAQDYAEVFRTFHSAIRQKEFDKLVLSSPFCAEGLWESRFDALCKAYPHSLVYLLSTPQTGTWMGATPEVLLAGNASAWWTMALAGTKTAEPEWDEKNIREQQLVSTFIYDVLMQYADDVQMGDAYTMHSGALCHLRTDFHFSLPSSEVCSSLLSTLHPTPAVCGLPQQKALRFIREHEGYDRQYYSGFVGPVNAPEGTLLGVNIRCAKLLGEGKARIFAGSGLMPESTLESEWQEVKRKAQSLLQC